MPFSFRLYGIMLAAWWALSISVQADAFSSTSSSVVSPTNTIRHIALSTPRGGGGSISISNKKKNNKDRRQVVRLFSSVVGAGNSTATYQPSVAVPPAASSSRRRNTATTPSPPKPTVDISTGTIALPTNDEAIAMTRPIKHHWLTSMDGIVFCAYLCNVLALSLPVLLVPLAATEQVAVKMGGTAVNNIQHIASAVAGISSVAALGGATGKFANGFICQAFGSHICSKIYFFGLSLCSFLFATARSTNTLGYAFAGMEFFASIQWAALAVMLSNYYRHAPAAKLAAALTALGLSSTGGQIAAKTLGTVLSSSLHWRVVAQLGAATALVGGLIISRAPKSPLPEGLYNNNNNKNLIKRLTKQSTSSSPSSKVTLQSIGSALKHILGSCLFWMLALSHAMAFVARGTDRILGTFFQNMAPVVPQALAGGLTLSVTLGLVHGLTTGTRRFTEATGVKAKKQLLAKRYAVSFLATVGLAITAQFGATMITSKVLLTALIALLSGTMASNVAFQYFQFPAMIAKSKFAKYQPVVISFLDGFGFLLSAPIFAATSRLVPTRGGWASAWVMLATLFGVAGVTMLRSLTSILQEAADDEAAAVASQAS